MQPQTGRYPMQPQTGRCPMQAQREPSTPGRSFTLARSARTASARACPPHRTGTTECSLCSLQCCSKRYGKKLRENGAPVRQAIRTHAWQSLGLMEESMVQEPVRQAVRTHAWPGFHPSNIVNLNNTHLVCNTLTMNSVAALMTSHSIVNLNNTIHRGMIY
jgi:hypothetical protein